MRQLFYAALFLFAGVSSARADSVGYGATMDLHAEVSQTVPILVSKSSDASGLPSGTQDLPGIKDAISADELGVAAVPEDKASKDTDEARRVPEPSGLAMLGMGILGLVGAVRGRLSL